jgi:hypothetical protein
MDSLTEKSPYKDLLAAWKEVNDYGYFAANEKNTKKALKKKGVTLARWVNTPKKNRALYIYARPNKKVYFTSFLIVEGSEGDSFVAMEDDKEKMTVLHSHAINRYIERHGYDGTLEQCQCYILNYTMLTAQNVDTITKEVVVYFDEGVFLGCVKDNVTHLNTYVSNNRLYTNQRLMSRRLQDMLDEIMKKMRNK